MVFHTMGKKIGIFLQALPTGGAERMMLNLASGMVDQGIAVDLVLAVATGSLLTAVPPEVRLVDLGARRTVDSILPLARYLRRERPTALLSALTHVNVAAVFATLLSGHRTRIVVSERSTISQESAEVTGATVHLAYKLVPWTYARADGIVAVSSRVAKDLSNYTNLPLEQISVINNPVVTKNTLQLASEPVDHPWFGPDQPPVILGVGRFSPEKDFGTLVRAFEEVRRSRPARLVLLGEGRRERAKLEAMVEQLGLQEAVYLPGFVKNPHAYMSRAAALVLTSRWEGSPNVLVEAMACGTPVVSTDCQSGPREILEDGRYGRLCPVGDSRQIAQAILETLTDPVPPESLRRRAEDFAVENSVKNYLGVLMDGVADQAL
jgi:glycosyltransferase involved in cell wall biosynthesis